MPSFLIAAVCTYAAFSYRVGQPVEVMTVEGPEEIAQLWHALYAFHAMPDGGRPIVRTALDATPKGG